MSETRAAVYLRISQDPKGDGLANERQESDCLRILESKEWKLTRTYRDTASASKRNVVRPEYDQMLVDFEAGEFDALVCYDLDRLTRQPRQLEDWIDLAEDKGLVLVTANGEADLSQDNGRTYARIKAAIAKGEIEAKSRRQKSKNVQKIEAGMPVPGRRRYGYEPGNLVPREPEATIVRNIYRDFIAGASIRSLAMREGRRTGWLREILVNQSYAGLVRHKGEYLPGKTAALVTPAVSEAARAILADPARKTSPGSAPKHLMSGIAVCGVCQAHLVYMRAYRCKQSSAHVSMLKQKLDPLVIAEVFQWIVEHPGLKAEHESPRLTALLAESGELNRQRAVLQSTLTWEGVDLTKLQRDIAAIGKQALRVEKDITRERNQTVRGGVVEQVRREWWDRRDVAEFTEHEEKALEEWPGFWMALPIERQREIVRSMLLVEVNPGNIPEERTVFTWLD